MVVTILQNIASDLENKTTEIIIDVEGIVQKFLSQTLPAILGTHTYTT